MKIGEIELPDNSMIVDGVFYTLVEDNEPNVCKRCKLRRYCLGSTEEQICNNFPVDFNHRFETWQPPKYNALIKHADKLQHIIDYMRRQRATQTKIIEDIYQMSTSKDVKHKTAREHIIKLCEKCISECEDTYNEARKNGWI